MYKLKTGDFVQMSDWFGDVWAEVLHVSGDPLNDPDDYWQVYYCQYNKGGTERWIGSDSLVPIRKYITKEEAQRGSNELWRCKISGVVHTVDEYFGNSGSAPRYQKWPSKLFDGLRWSSNYREKLQKEGSV